MFSPSRHAERTRMREVTRAVRRGRPPVAALRSLRATSAGAPQNRAWFSMRARWIWKLYGALNKERARCNAMLAAYQEGAAPTKRRSDSCDSRLPYVYLLIAV